MKKHLLFIIFFLTLAFCMCGNIASARAANDDSRSSNKDEAMLYTWLRYGGPIPDSLLKTLKFRGTGFTATPSKLIEIVSDIAAQWIFGINPPGVSNYSSDMVTEGKNNNAYSDKEAKLLRDIGAVAMGGIPTEGDTDIKSNDPYEQAKIETFNGGIANIALSDRNSTGMFLRLMSAAIGRSTNLAATAPDLHGMLPEQKDSRKIGQGMSNPYNSNINSDNALQTAQNNTGARVAGTGTSRLTNGQVLEANTTNTDTDSPYDVFTEGITIPQGLQNVRAALAESIPVFSIMSNPKATSDTPVKENSPSNIYGADMQKNVTSASLPGNARLFGKNNEVAGLTNKLPGASMGNLEDAINVAARNSADQINNLFNQLNNAQNQFPNGRLDQLRDQFSEDDFNNQLGNRFPDSSGGSGSGPNPVATPATPNSECSAANATLAQKEAEDVADFLGLPIVRDNLTAAYLKAETLIGNAFVALGDPPVLTLVSSAQIPNPADCSWVIYVPSEKTGVFVADVRSPAGAKFMFTMP